MRIETHTTYNDLPVRSVDWAAVTSDYGGEWGDPVGYGSTREEAIEDLISLLEPGTIYELDGQFYQRPSDDDDVESN